MRDSNGKIWLIKCFLFTLFCSPLHWVHIFPHSYHPCSVFLSGAEKRKQKTDEVMFAPQFAATASSLRVWVCQSASPQAGTRHPKVEKQRQAAKLPPPDTLRRRSFSSILSVMAFTLSEIMAARRQQSQAQSHGQRGSRAAVEVDEYSTNPTQAFTFYNINQGRFQPPHVHM